VLRRFQTNFEQEYTNAPISDNPSSAISGRQSLDVMERIIRERERQQEFQLAEQSIDQARIQHQLATMMSDFDKPLPSLKDAFLKEHPEDLEKCYEEEDELINGYNIIIIEGD